MKYEKMQAQKPNQKREPGVLKVRDFRDHEIIKLHSIDVMDNEVFEDTTIDEFQQLIKKQNTQSVAKKPDFDGDEEINKLRNDINNSMRESFNYENNVD